MRKIVSIKFGSHLYGTATPNSDLDFKSVFVPDANDILLQKVKNTLSVGPEKLASQKNKPGDVDEESFSIQRFLKLASEGQTVALDVLFAPDWAMTMEPTFEWREVIANRHWLLTRKSAAFVGYCRQQANKYGIKGSRVAAARKALNILDAHLPYHHSSAKLDVIETDIRNVCHDNAHMSIDTREQPGGTLVKYWNVCGRMLQFTASLRHARDVMKLLVDEYGQRALQAETQQGVDWKALSHAVRVGTQALELLKTGNVTFPLPNAEHVLAIKTGKLLYQNVAAEIEDLLVRVEGAAAASMLPEEPDHVWIDGFVLGVHAFAVVTAFSPIVMYAERFAHEAHASVGQIRKYTGEPYIVHPASVVAIVKTVRHTPEMLAAAWLHDVVEDTPVTIEEIQERFGEEVAKLVWWLSDQSKPSDGNRARRKEIDRLHASRAGPQAQTIKYADIIDNMRTIETHDPDFARVYRHEINRLLDVMTEGDPVLYAQARAAVAKMEDASH